MFYDVLLQALRSDTSTVQIEHACDSEWRHDVSLDSAQDAREESGGSPVDGDHAVVSPRDAVLTESAEACGHLPAHDMFRVNPDTLQAYLDFDPIRKIDLQKLDKLLRSPRQD